MKKFTGTGTYRVRLPSLWRIFQCWRRLVPSSVMNCESVEAMSWHDQKTTTLYLSSIQIRSGTSYPPVLFTTWAGNRHFWWSFGQSNNQEKNKILGIKWGALHSTEKEFSLSVWLYLQSTSPSLTQFTCGLLIKAGRTDTVTEEIIFRRKKDFSQKVKPQPQSTRRKATLPNGTRIL